MKEVRRRLEQILGLESGQLDVHKDVVARMVDEVGAICIHAVTAGNPCVFLCDRRS